ncbi:membrane protein of unknown function [uncultured Sphingopyxis sp.]|uniref:Major facilitator superfamily (MFS) profile domain-containing protein n=1 Tax=uncultured Sphingopyxis sp. TaxID=310581 RepID=A0A1Y5PX25_9SPHN|nr:membrane protein of unknown function [uncultured Sphingopyxis sp.]
MVVMMAMVMALNALAIDSMLPALPAIGETLGVTVANDRQHVISIYLLGIGFGSLLYGPLSDRFGRKGVLVPALFAYLALSIGCGLATSFAMLLALRFIHGLVSAALGVIVVAVIRDLFAGDAMAKRLSLIFLVFMIVPIIAPTIGAGIAAVAGWRASRSATWSISARPAPLMRMLSARGDVDRDAALAAPPARNARPRRRAPARLRDDGRGLGDGDAPPPRRGLYDRVGHDAGRALWLSQQQRADHRRGVRGAGAVPADLRLRRGRHRDRQFLERRDRRTFRRAPRVAVGGPRLHGDVDSADRRGLERRRDLVDVHRADDGQRRARRLHRQQFRVDRDGGFRAYGGRRLVVSELRQDAARGDRRRDDRPAI